MSVIVLNFNGENYLEQCLFSVLGTKYPNFEVIFVDNGSRDSSLKVVEKAFGNDKRLRIFRSPQNLGFSGGMNFGFSHARGDYIVFLNNDTVTDLYWLSALVNIMEEDGTIGLAQSIILSIDGKKVYSAGWLWSDYLLELHSIGGGKRSDFKFPLSFEVSFVSGVSFIVRRELLDEIGLFDPEIPFNYDDTLLSFKVWLAGKRVVTASSSRIRHMGAASTKKFRGIYSMLFSNYRARLCLMFDYYFNFKDLLRALFILNFSVAIESTVLIRERNLSLFLARIHATVWVIKNFKHVWKNRLDHWSIAKVTPETLLAKTIRIRLHFPLWVVPTKLNYLIHRYEIVKYENALIGY